MQSDSNQYQGGSQTVFDPQTDTVYDLEQGYSKRIRFIDRMGNPLRAPTGQEARLYHLWNTTAKGMVGLNPTHAQHVLGEAILELLGREASLTDDSIYTSQHVMNQFCIGLGLFIARNGIRVEIETERMSEVDIAKIRRKFTDDQ